MNKNTSPNNSPTNGSKHSPQKKSRVELILSGLFLIGFILYLFNIPGGAFILLLSLLSLSTLYFLFSFIILNGISLRKIFKKESYKEIKTIRIIGTIVIGVFLFNAVIGTLFKIVSWPGFEIMILVGGLGLLIIGPVVFIKQLNSKSVLNTIILTRICILAVVVAILYALPNYSIKTIKYRNYPAYVKTLKALEKDPGNKVLREKANEEYHKIRRNDGSR